MRVFVDLPSRRPELLHVDPPNVAFERGVGLTLERYLAICFAVVIRFSVWNREPDSWLLGDGYWVNSTVSPEEFRLAVRTFANPVATVRKAIKKDIEAGYNSIDDIWPFITNPLIEIEKGAFLTLDVETLGDALLGDGLYWRMKYNPGASEQERGNLGEAYGHLVEAHCLEVAEPCFSDATDAQLFDEKRYTKVVDGQKDQNDGPDVVVSEEPDVVFVEIGIDRPTCSRRLCAEISRASTRTSRRSFFTAPSSSIARLTTSSAATCRFDGVSAADVRRIHPVICLIHGFPVVGLLYERIKRRFVDAGTCSRSSSSRSQSSQSRSSSISARRWKPAGS